MRQTGRHRKIRKLITPDVYKGQVRHVCTKGQVRQLIVARNESAQAGQTGGKVEIREVIEIELKIEQVRQVRRQRQVRQLIGEDEESL
jgi:hypothetical protein